MEIAYFSIKRIGGTLRKRSRRRMHLRCDVVAEQSRGNRSVIVAEQPICPFPVRFRLCKGDISIRLWDARSDGPLWYHCDSHGLAEGFATLPSPPVASAQRVTATSETRERLLLERRQLC